MHNVAGCHLGIHTIDHNKRRSFSKSRIRYYQNSDATLQVKRLLLSGDCHPNPGPSTVRKKCDTCHKSISRNHRVLLCSVCESWNHIKCAEVSPSEYKRLKSQINLTWMCATCEHFQQTFPLANINIFEDSQSCTYNDSFEFQDNLHTELSDLERTRQKYNRELLICHLNINSLQNKFEEMRDIILKLKTQIMIIGETKIDSSYPDSQFEIPGYSIYRNDRKKGGGGILAFVSSCVTCRRLKLDRTYKTLEPLVLEVIVNNKVMIIVAIYRPPKNLSGAYQLKLEEELSSICNWASLRSQTIIAVGDLNLDRLRPDKAEGKLLMNLEEEQGFTCLIDKPTRVQPRGSTTTETLIDVILTNKPDIFIDCGIDLPNISDHALIYGFVNEKVKRYKNKVIKFRSEKKINPERFREDLCAAPWHVGEIFDTVDEQANFWSALMLNIVDEHLPMKKMRVREHDVPYMSKEWKKAIREKRKAAKLYAKNSTVENWELKRKLRNKATRLRRKAIRNYWGNKAEDLKNNPKQFYKTFMPFLGGKKDLQPSNITLKVDNVITKDQEQIAETFGNYFASIADQIGGPEAMKRAKLGTEKNSSVSAIRDNLEITNSFNFESINNKEVEQALNALNINKATGWDLIPAKALKIGAKELSPSLAKLYNSCIIHNYWPTSWKRGEWIPAFKKDNPQEKENYRPLTIQIMVNKVFEQLLSKQVVKGLDKKLSDNLTAYRKTHSCETTLVMLTEHWKHGLDSGKTVGVLSTDMSKAFDSLNHSLLLSKLRAYGFTDSATNLLESYFTDRLNRVKLNDVTSTWKVVTRGCPQGSAFGPLMWNIFQNDLNYKINPRSHMYVDDYQQPNNLCMFADDHQLYEMDKCFLELQSKLQENAVKASEWYDENMLKGNYGKYKTLTMGKQRENITVKIGGVEIESTEKLKLLGVTIDNQLQFTEHISNVCKRSSQRVGVLMRLRNLIPTRAKLQLYKSAILPYLTYCHTVWHFCRQSDARKLERVQERALRAVYCDSHSTYQQLLVKAELTTLVNRRLQDIAIIMYKVKHEMCPLNIRRLFKRQNSAHNLRNSDFIIPRFETVTYGKHSLRYLGPKLWQLLNQECRNQQSLTAFKRCIRTQDLNQFLADDCRNCILCSRKLFQFLSILVSQ